MIVLYFSKKNSKSARLQGYLPNKNNWNWQSLQTSKAQ